MASHHQPDMFGYPDRPGFNFRDTAQAVAKRIAGGAAAIRVRILSELQVRGSVGGTCDEIEQAMGLSHQTASARIRELNMKDRIFDSGLRRKTRSGREAIVWFANREDMR